MAINSNNNNNRNSNKSPSNRGFSDFDSNYPSGFSKKSTDVSYSPVSDSYLDAIKKNTQFNKETLHAIQTLEKNIDSIIFSNNKEFDKYIENLHKVVKEQKEVQEALAQEKEQTDRKNKENLLLLLSQIEQLTGLNAQEIAEQLSDMNSEMFQKLPNEFKDSLTVLLKGNRNFINDVIQEYKERVKKEQEIELERKQQLKKFFNNYLEKTNEVFDKNSDVLKQAFLGPLNVLLSPLEEFFNFDTYDKLKGFLFGTEGRRGEDRKAGIFEKIGKKLFKKRPTVNDVAKTGDMGSLLINQTLQDIKKNKKSVEENDFNNFSDEMFGNILGNAFTKMLPSFISALPAFLGVAIPVLIAGGLIAGLIRALSDKELMGKWGKAKEDGEKAYGDVLKQDRIDANGNPTITYYMGQRNENVPKLSNQSPMFGKWEKIKNVALSNPNSPENRLYQYVVSNTQSGDYKGKEPEFLLSLLQQEAKLRPEQKQWSPIINKYHTGGIIGSKDNFGSINNNYVIAQKGEVILPISESQYGLKTGILQPTVDGGIKLNKNIYNGSNNYYDILNKEIQLNRNIPAISIEDINPITPTDYNMNSQNVNVSDLEKKLDVIISVLQNILKKDPVIIPENKQSSKDLELLIYGGAL